MRKRLRRESRNFEDGRHREREEEGGVGKREGVEIFLGEREKLDRNGKEEGGAKGKSKWKLERGVPPRVSVCSFGCRRGSK